MDEDSFVDALTGEENFLVTLPSPASIQNIKRTPLSPNATNILNNINQAKVFKLSSPDIKIKKVTFTYSNMLNDLALLKSIALNHCVFECSGP